MDLIIINGSVLTMDKENPLVEAVAVKNGKIAAAGTNGEILGLRREGTLVIDAGGKSVLPGFHDSHLHLYGYAITKSMVDLTGLTGIDELQTRLRNHIQSLDPAHGEWIVGRGWDQTHYREQRMINRHDLDRVSLRHPILLKRKCGHVCVLNTFAMKLAGIYEQPPVVEGGLIELDQDGKPNGILKENAMELVALPAGEKSQETVKALITLATRDFVKAGLTSIQADDLGAFPGDPSLLFEAYLDLASQGQLLLRVNEQMLLQKTDQLKKVIEMGYRTGVGNDSFRIGPLKLLTDGSFGGRSALLSAPYTDDPGNCGIALFAGDSLRELVTLAHMEGMQVAAHAIGDRAIAELLDIYREVQEEFPREDPRFRVIHASMATPELLDRFKEQAVLADVQPGFVPSDLPFLEHRLGKTRASSAYCFKDFLKRGIPLGGSSDCPVEDYRPLMGIHAAVNRQGHDGEPRDGWLPEQKLTIQEALYLYTMGSAFNAYEENLKGSISAGKLADLVILSGSIEKIDPEQIKDLSVEKTIVGGKVVFSC